ncbi:MAG: ABC transporter ATP-binding protein [Mariprofundaceae bacterium]|nr:ABC transporter ATP-binding protein [Mariprofundaceae bacterium]
MLDLHKITLMRGNHHLFSDFDCPIHAAEITVILGPNGAGKSSLLLAMAGLIPVVGCVLFNNKPLHHYPQKDLAQYIAWQGELPPTEFGLTVHQRLSLVAGQGESIAVVANDMAITPLLGRSLGALSSGERQRVELAALMLRDAAVWLLDEPTAHLDLRYQIQCIHMLKKQAAMGRAIVVVLHDIQQAMAIADYFILMNKKRAVQYGKADTLCDADTLSALFDAPLIDKEGVLMPDY